MADKDKYADELLSDDELDNVAGGTMREILGDHYELHQRGLIHNGATPEDVNRVMHEMGYSDYNGDRRGDNVYTNKFGIGITREQFWKNFDEENGTKILPRDQRKW